MILTFGVLDQILSKELVAWRVVDGNEMLLYFDQLHICAMNKNSIIQQEYKKSIDAYSSIVMGRRGGEDGWAETTYSYQKLVA